MNDTRSTHRRGRVKARIAVVLCLMLVACIIPATAFAAPLSGLGTWSDANVEYLNSATINLVARGAASTVYSLDGGALVTGTKVTTSAYGKHTLAFRSIDASGNTEATITAPFFIDEDVAPTVVCDLAAAYVRTASIDVTVTDNANGSGVSYLYYRVDNGYLQQVIASSQSASALLMARLMTSSLMPAGIAPDLTSYDVTPPHGPFGTCSTCHDLVSSGGGGGGTPSGALVKTIAVTGIGTHTLQYWAQDVARNSSPVVKQTFVINKVATKLSIKRSASSVKRGSYVTISGVLSGGAPTGSKVVVQYRKPGTTKYVTLTTRTTSSTGAWSYKYKLGTKGTYYFKAVYSGDATYAGSTSAAVSVACK